MTYITKGGFFPRNGIWTLFDFSLYNRIFPSKSPVTSTSWATHPILPVTGHPICVAGNQTGAETLTHQSINWNWMWDWANWAVTGIDSIEAFVPWKPGRTVHTVSLMSYQSPSNTNDFWALMVNIENSVKRLNLSKIFHTFWPIWCKIFNWLNWTFSRWCFYVCDILEGRGCGVNGTFSLTIGMSLSLWSRCQVTGTFPSNSIRIPSTLLYNKLFSLFSISRMYNGYHRNSKKNCRRKVIRKK